MSPQTVRKEFAELQNYSKTSNACSSCAKRSVQCKHHSRQSICDKIKEIKRRRNIRPLIFIFCMNICYEFNGAYVLEPYNIQILNALGSPVEANAAMVWISGFGVVGSIFLIASIKRLGRRKIYLTSIFGIAVLCVGLGAFFLNSILLKTTAKFYWFHKFWFLSQLFMVLLSFHWDGRHSKKIQMNHRRICTTFDRE